VYFNFSKFHLIAITFIIIITGLIHGFKEAKHLQ